MEKLLYQLHAALFLPMVILMSVFGAIESCMATGKWSTIGWQYLMIFPRNLAMAFAVSVIDCISLYYDFFVNYFREGKILA